MLTTQEPAARDAQSLSPLYLNAFVCARRLVALNLKVTHSMVESNLNGMSALMGMAGKPEVFGRQAELAQGFLLQAFGYARDVNEVIAQNQLDLTSLLQAQSGGMTSLPAAGAMKELLNAMLGSASTARDNMIATARQMAEGAGAKPLD
jgi:hypothetical protein